jgi:tetratricopeptide (TPR) repeat protein
MLKSALEIFERLRLWEDVISCHQALNDKAKAEKVVLELLAITPDSPKLLCILGDLRSDHTLYLKAWEVSGSSFARAMRSLGTYYFKQKDFAKCIEAYENALAINPLFVNSWFVCGCAAMQTENWAVAIKAFSRVTSIDPEVCLRFVSNVLKNGEAWTNLAAVHIRINQKREGWRALREGIKHMYESYKIWENYLYCSMDLGEYGECVTAMQRILELRWDKEGGRDRGIDVEVLEHLVESIAGLRKEDGAPSTLMSKLVTLVEDITGKIATSPGIFKAAASAFYHVGNYRRALEFRLKAYRIHLNHPDMNGSPVLFKEIVGEALLLCDVYEEMGPKEQEARMGQVGEVGRMVCADWRYQVKMVLKTLSGRTRKNFEGSEEHEKLLARMELSAQ